MNANPLALFCLCFVIALCAGCLRETIPGAVDGGVDAGACGVCPTATPVCNDEIQCVECVADGDCEDGACTTDNVCVECLQDADCSDVDNARCESDSCAPCTDSAQCVHLGAASICEDGSGRCVECIQDSDCGDRACLDSGICGQHELASQQICEPCDADRECQDAASRCVVHHFAGADRGAFCFLKASLPDPDSGCGELNSARRPYRFRMDLSSVDGDVGNYCLPLTTTCQGLDHLDSIACSADTDCGLPDVDDGFCPPNIGAGRLCSYPCSGDVDCPATLVCGGFPMHCQLP